MKHELRKQGTSWIEDVLTGSGDDLGEYGA
jgi:hypothetical protein